jgi:hypothetical protein
MELYNMAGGLAWSPSYLLELGEGDTSKLTGKAVVVNDLEDLDETEVKLVIGFPNIEFAGVDSVLAPSLTLEAWANMLRGAAASSSRSQAPVMLQQVRTVASPADVSYSGGSLGLEGQGSEDLFVYEVGRMTLGKGERAYVPLSSQTVRHEHRFD